MAVTGSPKDNLHSVNTSIGVTTLIEVIDISMFYIGLAINFSTDELYALSGYYS